MFAATFSHTYGPLLDIINASPEIDITKISAINDNPTERSATNSASRSSYYVSPFTEQSTTNNASGSSDYVSTSTEHSATTIASSGSIHSATSPEAVPSGMSDILLNFNYIVIPGETSFRQYRLNNMTVKVNEYVNDLTRRRTQTAITLSNVL